MALDAEKRLTESTLPNDKFKDGDVLYGKELNLVVSLLRQAVNENYDDLKDLSQGRGTVISTKDKVIQFLRLDESGYLEYSKDGGQNWLKAYPLGHIILDDSGNTMGERKTIQFKGLNVEEQDDKIIVHGAKVKKVSVEAVVQTVSELQNSGETYKPYVVLVRETNTLWAWDVVSSKWENLGSLKGERGERGEKGDDGRGLIAGGLQGQVYAKRSNNDYDGEWINLPERTSTITTSTNNQLPTAMAVRTFVSNAINTLKNSLTELINGVSSRVQSLENNKTLIVSGFTLNISQVVQNSGTESVAFPFKATVTQTHMNLLKCSPNDQVVFGLSRGANYKGIISCSTQTNTLEFYFSEQPKASLLFDSITIIKRV